jgi:hypothetical protein
MEEVAAKKMGAVTTTLSSCHMVILEEPAKVAKVIDEDNRTWLLVGCVTKRGQHYLAGSGADFPMWSFTRDSLAKRLMRQSR